MLPVLPAQTASKPKKTLVSRVTTTETLCHISETGCCVNIAKEIGTEVLGASMQCSRERMPNSALSPILLRYKITCHAIGLQGDFVVRAPQAVGR